VRRRSRAASTGTEERPEVAPVPVAAPAEPAASTTPVPVPVPAASAAEPGERTDDDLLREARAYRDELAAAGERISKDKLRIRFAIGSGKALELARTLRGDEQDDNDTREAAI
jgi:3-oxoacyl-ACP reductase-like protein